MFICEIWLFDWYFPQYCTSDMSKYGYLEGPFDFEIARVACILKVLGNMPGDITLCLYGSNSALWFSINS